MKVERIMERIGSNETGKMITYIKDALSELNMLSSTHINTENFDLTKDKRFYPIPNEALNIISIRVKNHLNSKDEYRNIPRLINEPKIVDADDV